MNSQYLTALSTLVCAYQHFIEHNKGNHIEVVVVPEELNISADNVPGDLLRANNGKQSFTLLISSAHSQSSIYGLVGNVLFRTAHDIAHLKYRLGFTTQDELVLAERHWSDLRDFIPKDFRPMCQAIFMADTAGQSLYYERHGCFPEDQRALVHDILRNQGWL